MATPVQSELARRWSQFPACCRTTFAGSRAAVHSPEPCRHWRGGGTLAPCTRTPFLGRTRVFPGFSFAQLSVGSAHNSLRRRPENGAWTDINGLLHAPVYLCLLGLAFLDWGLTSQRNHCDERRRPRAELRLSRPTSGFFNLHLNLDTRSSRINVPPGRRRV